MAAFSHNGEPGSALDRELRGLNCRGCDCRSVRISELERELAAAQLARDAQKERADDLLEEYTKVKDSLKRAEARAESYKRDAERLDWLDKTGHESGHGFCHVGFGDYRYYAHMTYGGVKYSSAREVIDKEIASISDGDK